MSEHRLDPVSLVAGVVVLTLGTAGCNRLWAAVGIQDEPRCLWAPGDAGLEYVDYETRDACELGVATVEVHRD